MTNGWEESADAWIARQGEQGDWGRRCVLDPVILPRVGAIAPNQVLDVGCGEGRFCRLLSKQGIRCVGLDPTASLIERARELGHAEYVVSEAEQMPFDNDQFDLVIAYLSLIDIEDFQSAIQEIARVTVPGGSVLVANMNSFNTAGQHIGWVEASPELEAHYPVVNYLSRRADWVAWAGIRIQNWHRPLSDYMKAFLASGLQLTWFEEPPAINSTAERTAKYNSAPYFVAMEWKKPLV